MSYTDHSNGEIRLSNNWFIRVDVDSDKPKYKTVIEVSDPNGGQYDVSTVLINLESPPNVVQEFEKSASQLPDIGELGRLETHNSQVIRELVRILPEFDSQGNRI
ncbi:hypothetical protein RYH80_05850 [Halobaculum sp. MBLA0147]|uniref:hypothetical protein n=1 Tax=Halobaculum sp. MBLA0147 TaxID=3079934 RepID=UPI00352364CF